MPRKKDIRILVVDDEPDVLELVEFHLEKEQFNVAVMDNGDQALKMARELLPSLLILDLMLPGINGLEICRLLRSDPKTRDIPILMLTARAAVRRRPLPGQRRRRRPPGGDASRACAAASRPGTHPAC